MAWNEYYISNEFSYDSWLGKVDTIVIKWENECSKAYFLFGAWNVNWKYFEYIDILEILLNKRLLQGNIIHSIELHLISICSWDIGSERKFWKCHP